MVVFLVTVLFLTHSNDLNRSGRQKGWRLFCVIKRNNVYTTQCRTIYVVIEANYFKESDTFPDDFIKKCKDNKNEAINIPIEVKITYIEWQWNQDYMHN